MKDPKLSLRAQVETPGIIHVAFELVGSDETVNGSSKLLESQAQEIALNVLRAQGAASERARIAVALRTRVDEYTRSNLHVGHDAVIVLERAARDIEAGRL